MTGTENTPPALNVEVGALLTECRIAAHATCAGIETLQNRAGLDAIRPDLALLHGLASRTVDALDEAMNALWGALGLASLDAANDDGDDAH